VHQDIRELHIGLLNMMPDAALAGHRAPVLPPGRREQPDRPVLHASVHPEGAERDRGVDYVERYYETFDRSRPAGLDALIITGANVTQPTSPGAFWKPLIEVIDWAYANVTSTLCSCLATHAVLQFRYGQRRNRCRPSAGASIRTGHGPRASAGQ
jgi:homoserine O-succinyltransferase/O-acetyltransferase